MKRNKVGKFILIVFLSLIIIGVSYIGSFYLDKLYRYYGNVELKVTFDDTETYIIPNTVKSSEEEAVKEWPYIFTIQNEGTRKGLYQLIIKDVDTSTIKRDDLDYLLVLDDEKVSSGSLKNINDDILYTYEIDSKTNQCYKLYIWSNSSDTKNTDIYEYQLTLNAIKEGGPGF